MSSRGSVTWEKEAGESESERFEDVTVLALQVGDGPPAKEHRRL